MALNLERKLIPIALSGYTRLFESEVADYRVPKTRSALNKMYIRQFDYAMFCQAVHNLNKPEPIDRREMETLWAHFCRKMFRLWEIREMCEIEDSRDAQAGAIPNWKAAFQTYCNALEWVDSYKAEKYWRNKVKEPGYEKMDIQDIPTSEDYEDFPGPDGWVGNVPYCKLRDGKRYSLPEAKRIWWDDKYEIERLIDEAYTNFYEPYIGKTPEEKKQIGLLRKFGTLSVSEPPRKKRALSYSQPDDQPEDEEPADKKAKVSGVEVTLEDAMDVDRDD